MPWYKDNDQIPRDELRAAYAGVLRTRHLDHLDLGDERGLPRLVLALRDFLRRTRGLTGREIMLTHGSQEAIALVAQGMLGEGDAVAVGDPGFPPAWDAFRAAGARLVPVPVDDGITQAAVASWIEDGGFERHLRRSRLVYRERRDAAFAAIEEAQRAGCRVSCHLPDGGLALWTRWAALDTWRLARRAREHGVLFAPERLLRVTPGRTGGARLAFSRHTPEELRAAIGIVARLARAGS